MAVKEPKKNAQVQETKKEDIFEVQYLNRWQLVWRALKKHKLGLFSLWVLIIMYLIALFADFLAPHDPYEQAQNLSYAPPSKIHWIDEEGKFTWPFLLIQLLQMTG